MIESSNCQPEGLAASIVAAFFKARPARRRCLGGSFRWGDPFSLNFVPVNNLNNTTGKRIAYFDFLKGAGILLVIFGHAIQRNDTSYENNYVYKLIYSFHMPFFIFVSGYIFAFSDTPPASAKWLVKKAERLLIPFFAWIPIYYAASNFTFTGLVFHDYSIGFPRFLLTCILHPSNSLWFLWVLFLCFTAFFIVSRIFKIEKTWAWLIVATAVVPLRVVHYFGFDAFGALFPYFVLGYISKMNDLLSHRAIKYMALVAIPVFPLLALDWPFTNPWWIDSIHLQKAAFIKAMGLVERYTAACAGILLMTLAARALSLVRFFGRGVIFLGKISLELYVTHLLFLRVGIGQGWTRIIVVFFAAVSLATLLQFILKRNPLVGSIMYGFRPKSGNTLSNETVRL